MTEIRQVLEKIPPKKNEETLSDEIRSSDEVRDIVFIDIPEVFFEEILERYSLNRNEIRVLMYLYRQVWCYPNLYQKYGISHLNDLLELSKKFNLSYNDLYKTLKTLESYEFIFTIRSGQYFVRRYFLPELDELNGQEYDDFDY